ncbi:MAG: Fructose-bisphosphate aldolase class 1 [Candidatus Midichloria mitochondrii]
MVRMNSKIKEIISYYDSDNPGVRSNLVKILNHGKLAGTGHLVILPVDQGFEHGPAKSFSMNKHAYDPEYHISLALEAGLSAYAAPLGMLEVVAAKYAGEIPFILKINSSNSLSANSSDYDQAVTASVEDALRLGCSAIGFTIYPGSDRANDMIEEIQKISLEAKRNGLAIVIWSYPRGRGISKKGETAIDVIAYAAHIAALIGAHIIKVKLPSSDLELSENKGVYEKNSIKVKLLAERVHHIMSSAFAGKRMVLFSGGASKDNEELFEEIKAIKNGGGTGSIIGRNTFQRPKEEALKMLAKTIGIYSADFRKNLIPKE